jgi:PST family polysaccharide transporter
MSDLFAFQLLGDFFKIASWLLAYLMLAKTMTKLYVFTEIFSNLSWVLFSYWLISYTGSSGAVIAYAINYFIYVLIMLFIFRKLLFNKIPSL